jgi:hypothetical protein
LPVLLFGLLVLTGCGDSTMAPVKGRVTCNGKAVAQASIVFAPVPRFEGDKEPGRSATGFTEPDGTYVLSTHKPLDGALVGKHLVTVSLDDANPAGRICKRSKQYTLEVKPGDNELNLELNQ